MMKELWNNLFDISLENYKNEDIFTRNLSMLFHVLKLEFEKTCQYISDLKRENDKLSQLNQHCKCIKNNRTPLKVLNVSSLESTPKKSTNNQDTSSNLISDNEDLLNVQISEGNLSKENDESLFIIDNSLENIEIIKSPTLNKSKRISRKNQSKKRLLLQDTVIENEISQIKLNESLKSKNSSISQKELCTTRKNIDDDETFVPIDGKIEESRDEVELEEILNYLKDNTANKKIKLDNSYDCIPESSASPDFVYKREAVRKKSERLKLQGWDCPDCKKYYATFKDLPENEIKKRMNNCSRHRDKFNPNILTPKGFWNPDFTVTQEDSFAFNLE